MKIWSFILVTLLFVISLQPCSDRGSNSTNESFSVSDQDNHQSNDFCSPLCSCACCGVPVVVFVQAPASVKYSTSFQKSIPLYKENFFSEISTSIWQPPKMS